MEDAATDLLPNVLCEYLYTLSGMFTDFYTNCKVSCHPAPFECHLAVLQVCTSFSFYFSSLGPPVLCVMRGFSVWVWSIGGNSNNRGVWKELVILTMKIEFHELRSFHWYNWKLFFREEILWFWGYLVLNVQVVGSEEEVSRLLLCEATAVIMRECFKLLGIKPLYRLWLCSCSTK